MGLRHAPVQRQRHGANSLVAGQVFILRVRRFQTNAEPVCPAKCELWLPVSKLIEVAFTGCRFRYGNVFGDARPQHQGRNFAVAGWVYRVLGYSSTFLYMVRLAGIGDSRCRSPWEHSGNSRSGVLVPIVSNSNRCKPGLELSCRRASLWPEFWLCPWRAKKRQCNSHQPWNPVTSSSLGRVASRTWPVVRDRLPLGICHTQPVASSTCCASL